MAVTFGFYDAVNGDRRYKAEEFSRLFEGIIRDGVFASIGTSLVVEAVGGMDVAIGVGRAWFENTWIDNDSPYIMKLDPAHISKNRIDAVVIEVDKDNRETIFKVVKGSDTEGVANNPVLTDHQYPLAYISVGLGVHEIIQANVINTVGTEACPFISGVLETITIEGVTVLLEDEFNRWFDGVKGQLDEDVAGALQNQINDLNIIIPKAFTSSYQAFIENINTDSLDAAFGKNNENNIRYLGRQLAMYAWFMGEDPILRPYVELQKINNLIELTNGAVYEILNSEVLYYLVTLSSYAKNIFTNIELDSIEIVQPGSGIITIPENTFGYFLDIIGPGYGRKRGKLIQTNLISSFLFEIPYEISLEKTVFNDITILKTEAVESVITLDTTKIYSKIIKGNNGGNGGAGQGGGGGGSGYGAGGGAGGISGGGGGGGGYGGIQPPSLSLHICGAGGGTIGSDGGAIGGSGGSSLPTCSGSSGGGSSGAAGGANSGAAGGGASGAKNSAGGAGGNGGYGPGGNGGGSGYGAGGQGTPAAGAIIIYLL